MSKLEIYIYPFDNSPVGKCSICVAFKNSLLKVFQVFIVVVLLKESTVKVTIPPPIKMIQTFPVTACHTLI